MQQFIQDPFLASMLSLLVVLWVLPWKGYALWISAKKGQKWWFIALLVINTLAILEILYIFVFSKKKDSANSKYNNEK